MVKPWPPGIGIDPACPEISFPRGLDLHLLWELLALGIPFLFLKKNLFNIYNIKCAYYENIFHDKSSDATLVQRSTTLAV